ncbi:ANM_collapsed_G0032070.mRNA.1.CDS.1 [Saccharomyces cerevisiae]|nr:ANM_collapsed_G0032070.mRNA.1.CDS.1 [Saccharomyces cerevisiae]
MSVHAATNPINKHVVLIDNYDSFTWNVYEYLCQEGAKVSVYRNDAITVPEIAALNPDTLLISPGPGHPKDRFWHFKRLYPQCMFDVFGGEVAYAGEIVHGKTSPISHDNCGIFKNVPQGIAVTRYHSLAGTESSLPSCLKVTASTENGIIMGVRHKKYTVEGVQFHPESILTEEGHLMIRNILNVSGGTWEENKSSPSNSILDRIYARRKIDVNEQSKIPGFTFQDLQSNYDLGLAPPLQDFYTVLSSSHKRAVVLAEVKRASPSKGPICLKAVAAEQALKYAEAGASAISVLTEPHWFHGSLQDLVNVGKILDLKFPPKERPCVLRKEFIFSKYQILEARLAGADTVLLIVKMLSQPLLKELYSYSKDLNMEPLVEVNSKRNYKGL